MYREWSSGLGEKIKQRNSYLSIADIFDTDFLHNDNFS